MNAQRLFRPLVPLFLLSSSLAGCLPFTPGQAQINEEYSRALYKCYADLEDKFAANRAIPYLQFRDWHVTERDRMNHCTEPLAKAKAEEDGWRGIPSRNGHTGNDSEPVNHTRPSMCTFSSSLCDLTPKAREKIFHGIA
jgi:hypothetical protein